MDNEEKEAFVRRQAAIAKKEQRKKLHERSALKKRPSQIPPVVTIPELRDRATRSSDNLPKLPQHPQHPNPKRVREDTLGNKRGSSRNTSASSNSHLFRATIPPAAASAVVTKKPVHPKHKGGEHTFTTEREGAKTYSKGMWGDDNNPIVRATVPRAKYRAAVENKTVQVKQDLSRKKQGERTKNIQASPKDPDRTNFNSLFSNILPVDTSTVPNGIPTNSQLKGAGKKPVPKTSKKAQAKKAADPTQAYVNNTIKNIKQATSTIQVANILNAASIQLAKSAETNPKYAGQLRALQGAARGRTNAITAATQPPIARASGSGKGQSNRSSPPVSRTSSSRTPAASSAVRRANSEPKRVHTPQEKAKMARDLKKILKP